MKPVLVGELNPHGADPRLALFPRPRNGAGYRLCSKIMGLSEASYLRSFERVNLCTGRWNEDEANERAFELKRRGRSTLVLLGRKVAGAFGLGNQPQFFADFIDSRLVVGIPHPSGLCRVWNKKSSITTARQLLMGAGVI